MSDFPAELDPLSIPQPLVPEPDNIRAGDTLQWEREFDQYPVTSGYSLSYVFIGKTVQYQVKDSMVVVEADAFKVTVPAATTAAWVAGDYRWQAYVKDGNGNRWTVAEGAAKVLPNLEAATSGIDDREPDEIILANIVAMLQGKAGADVQRYLIAGRELQRYTWSELTRMRSTYEQRVRKLRIARGENPPKKTIGVSFSNGY